MTSKCKWPIAFESIPLVKHALFKQGKYIWLSVTHDQHAYNEAFCLDNTKEKYTAFNYFAWVTQLKNEVNTYCFSWRSGSIRVRTHWTDKICFALPKFSTKFFNLSSVGALIHSKIFVNHKFQSHGNKYHRLLAVRRKGYMRSQESTLTASIEYVASAYYCLCSSLFASLNSFNSSRSSWYFYCMPVEASSCSTATFLF